VTAIADLEGIVMRMAEPTMAEPTTKEEHAGTAADGGVAPRVSLTPHPELLGSPAQPSHIVQFYEDDALLCDSVAHFLAVGLRAGEPVVVVATEEHRAAFAARLERRGIDVEVVRARGQLVWLDARASLSKFLIGDMPDWTLFSDLFGGVIEELTRRSPLTCVRAYGEMVDVLWRDGNKQAALALEAMWNELASSRSLSLLCAYVMGNFYRSADAESFRSVCRAHSHVLPAPGGAGIVASDNERREISELQQRALSLENELEHRKELERALREALLREKEAREEAERSVRYNELFAGMLGHDLRNPLSAITTGANYIARLNSSPKSAKAATRILTSAERMARMIDQLLDFTRIRVGGGLTLASTCFDLGELCWRVKEELEAANPERSIVVEVEGDVVGSWDQDRLQQVFSNLVGNALHHGTDGQPVRLRCHGCDPARVELSVHNEGVIPSQVLPVLFEPFRGHTRYQRTRGLGLGLFITHQIVGAHGGTIDVASDEAAGTTFRLGLPRGAGATPAREPPPLH
jgi:signal transduction histidine kinase